MLLSTPPAVCRFLRQAGLKKSWKCQFPDLFALNREKLGKNMREHVTSARQLSKPRSVQCLRCFAATWYLKQARQTLTPTAPTKSRWVSEKRSRIAPLAYITYQDNINRSDPNSNLGASNLQSCAEATSFRARGFSLAVGLLRCFSLHPILQSVCYDHDQIAEHIEHIKHNICMRFPFHMQHLFNPLRSIECLPYLPYLPWFSLVFTIVFSASCLHL